MTDKPYVYQDYPKALYVSPDQEGPYRVAENAEQELELRAEGCKPLAEWAAEPKGKPKGK